MQSSMDWNFAMSLERVRAQIEQCLPFSPCYFGFVHPFRSCFGVSEDYHAVFNMRLADSHWRWLTNNVERVWNGHTWDLEGVLGLLSEILPGIQVVQVDRL